MFGGQVACEVSCLWGAAPSLKHLAWPPCEDMAFSLKPSVQKPVAQLWGSS